MKTFTIITLASLAGAALARDPHLRKIVVPGRKDNTATSTTTTKIPKEAVEQIRRKLLTLSGVPGNLVLEYAIDDIPDPPTVTATPDDGCTAQVNLSERGRTSRDCLNEKTITRTWEAEDDCGNFASLSQTITIRDTRPPVLENVPSDVTLDACTDELPVAPTVTAVDDDGVTYEVTFVDEVGPTPAGGCNYVRTWTAEDVCENSVSAAQNIHFRDLNPPDYTGVELCIWPPSHKYVKYSNFLADNEDFKFDEATDDCGGAVTPTFISCSSSQDENDLGDVNTVDDCVYDESTDTLKVRGERQGTDPVGRFYHVLVVLTDECGNSVTTAGSIYVPHDVPDLEDHGFTTDDCRSWND